MRWTTRSTTRALATVGVTASLALGLVVVVGVGSGGTTEPVPAPAVAARSDLSPVEALRTRLESVPGDWTAWAALGSAYVEQSRVTGDPSLYPRAEEAFEQSLELQPQDNAAALTGQAGLAAARHDFALAAELAQRAVGLNAYDATAYGVLTDALVELGRYEEAATSLQRMADLSPGFAALARISYLRELRGDVAGARSAMTQAKEQAYSPGEVAFAGYHLGEIAFGTGDLDTAEREFEAALAKDPSAVTARAGLARVAAARGDVATAETEYRRVLDVLPTAEYATELGDLLRLSGRTDEAEEQYALVTAQTRLVEANGGRADLETALFLADHGDPVSALVLARREHDVRSTVHTDDALAWALHVNGRSAEALPLAERALRLGTRSAVLHFHKGMVESALGLTERARTSLRTALDINPHFSLVHAETARAELGRLAGDA